MLFQKRTRGFIYGMMLQREASFAEIGFYSGDGAAIRHAIEQKRMVSSGIENWSRGIGRSGFSCIVADVDGSARQAGNRGPRDSLQS